MTRFAEIHEEFFQSLSVIFCPDVSFYIIASFYWPTQSFVLDFDIKTPSVYKAFVCTTCLLRGLLLVSSCSCRSLAAIARA